MKPVDIFAWIVFCILLIAAIIYFSYSAGRADTRAVRESTFRRAVYQRLQ